MVFCCIALAGIAMIYFFGLWIRQLFLGRHRDLLFANYPPPPRALAGNGAWPVYGHTRLFRRHVGDVVRLFDPKWTELGVLSSLLLFSKRQLGDCFAVFIWGQWRVGIQGPTRAQQFLEHQILHEGWPWTPPVTLLGQSCLGLLQQEDPMQAAGLRQLLQPVLCHTAVVKFAPQFAQAAEQCLRDVERGCFRKAPRKRNKRNEYPASPLSNDDDDLDEHDDEEEEEGVCCKLKWEALRSYTLDVMDGPLFQMNLWKDDETHHPTKKNEMTSSKQQTHGQSTKEHSTPPAYTKTTTKKSKQDEPPSREFMLLWMERIKLGLDVIKMTFGPEWMYVWVFTEYGRAVNARMHVEKIVGEHVERMVQLVPQVTHERGHVYHEPTTQPFPLLAMRQNLMRSKEGIFGDYTVYPTTTTTTTTAEGNRKRSNSMPNGSSAFVVAPSPPTDGSLTSPYVKPFKTEQDLARPNYECSPTRRRRMRDELEDALERSWMELNEIHLQESQQGLSPLSQGEWGTSSSPRWNSRSMAVRLPLDGTETPFKMVTLDKEENKTTKDVITPVSEKPNQIKSVGDVFNEIKVNREKQKHLSEDNQVVYSFFNPTKRKPSAEASTPVLVKTVMAESEPKQMIETNVQNVNESSSRPTSERATHFKNELETPPPRAGLNGTNATKSTPYLKTASANLHDSDETALTAASLKTNTALQTPKASRQYKKNRNASGAKKRVVINTPNEKVCSLLETLLQQRGPEGKGISQTILMELSINLWMMLDVGNVWTAMALHLLAWDETALNVIHEELDVLEMEFGSELFSPEALARMEYLDALIYEAIRLVPPFLGGLKSTTETVILKDAGVQIPKGSHIFFCQPSEEEFDLFAAVGKRPECLGQRYPCVELFGFLPLQGLEVPLMVLQCKVFLIVTLRNNAPTVSKRNTFIRRVKSAVSFRKPNHAQTPEGSLHSLVECSDMGDPETGSNYSNGAWDLEDGVAHSSRKMTPSEAMKRFTKIPFPEPKRVIRLKPRGL